MRKIGRLFWVCTPERCECDGGREVEVGVRCSVLGGWCGCDVMSCRVQFPTWQSRSNKCQNSCADEGNSARSRVVCASVCVAVVCDAGRVKLEESIR